MRTFPSAVCNVLLLTMVASVAQASSITYNIDFSGGSPDPISGSFTYDTVGDTFTSFDVIWESVDFNFLPSANEPVSQNGCPLGGGAATIFSILTNGGQCNGLGLSDKWEVFPPNPQGNDFNSSLDFLLFNTSNAGYVIGGSDPDTSFIATPTSGTFTVVAAAGAPEPTTVTLISAGIAFLLLALRRRASPGSQNQG